jgi:hypothetical protein
MAGSNYHYRNFIIGQKFRNRKKYVYQRKALEIWRIMVH